jgi:hypothetical protein
MTAQQQLERLFAPDIRVKIGSDDRVTAFELVSKQGATFYLGTYNHGGILGQRFDDVLRNSPDITFEDCTGN